MFCCRMESTEKCEVVIQHFNGKYLKTPPGIPGESPSLALHYFHITQLLPFFLGKSSPFSMRNHLSNSIMVISHLRSAGQLDRLCIPLSLTPEASCRGYGWIADGPIGLFLSPSPPLSSSLSLPGGAAAEAGTSRAGESPLNIHTHASVLFFAIYLRACTCPSFLFCFCSLLLCPLAFLSVFFCSHPRLWKKLAKEKELAEKGEKCHKMETDSETSLYFIVC